MQTSIQHQLNIFNMKLVRFLHFNMLNSKGLSKKTTCLQSKLATRPQSLEAAKPKLMSTLVYNQSLKAKINFSQ